MSILLFQVYGSRRSYHLELTYSILSAARFLREQPADIRLILATDAANRRPDLPVEHFELTPAMLHNWQLNGTYNHAIKVYSLHHALQYFNAPVILVDSDTVINNHPIKMFERVGPGRSLMHASEGRLRKSMEWAEWSKLIACSAGSLSGYSISEDSIMYNSGVVGLHPLDAYLMDDVKTAMQEIRDNSDMFTAEQLATSLIFADKTKLTICDDLVEHYWGGPRAFYHYQMQQMFPSILNGEGINDPNVPLKPLARLPGVALRHKIAGRLKRLSRAISPEYETAYIAYRSALSLSSSNPDLANVWSTIALNMLQWGMRGQVAIPTDFFEFSSEQINAQRWMQTDLRNRWLNYWSSVKNCNCESASQ